MLGLDRFYADLTDLGSRWQNVQASLGKVVFTNGCFDILHAGHVAYLEEARSLGDYLVVGLNSDQSVKRLKGKSRPIVPFDHRALVLTGLKAVDLVVGFDEDTPRNLIHFLKPYVLVKGGDWSVDQIVGGSFVLESGGEVHSLQFKGGLSTTNIVDTIRRLPPEGPD